MSADVDFLLCFYVFAERKINDTGVYRALTSVIIENLRNYCVYCDFCVFMPRPVKGRSLNHLKTFICFEFIEFL